MAATPTTLRLERALRDLLDNTLDQQLRDLVTAWATAWDEIAPDLADTLADLATQAKTGRIQRGMLIRSQRLTAASAQIAQQLDNLAAQANVRIVGDLNAVVHRAYDAQRTIIGSQLPYTLDQLLPAARGNDRALDAIVHRATQQITSLTRPLSADAYDAVRRELIRGVAVGSNPTHTAKRILDRAEKPFNGGLARAINISRTETVDAHRAAAKTGQDEHPEVLAGWVWMAHLSDRTCQACLGMHGTLHPLSEPGPLGHQQCRCSRTPRTKTWAELGFDLPEPVDQTPDADQFFAALSPQQQRAILGDKGYEAWLAGDFPRDAWAVRRENDGWRDAYYAAKPGQHRPATPGGPTQPPGSQPPTGQPDPEDWKARQDKLPVDFRGDILEPHEVRFVERFLDAGHRMEWIPRDTTSYLPTNDFIWVNNARLPVELKSTKAKASTIWGRILTAVRKAAAQDVVKENFVIDIGDEVLTPELRERLASYNTGRRQYRIARLWVMSAAGLEEIHLNE